MRNAFLILDQPSETAIAWVVRLVNSVGLQVLRTFDLQGDQKKRTDCPCPYHGTEQCDCRVVVLLIYGGDAQPLSLTAHSHDAKTWFSLVDNPQQRADPYLETTILQVLTHHKNSPLDQAGWPHAY